MVVVSPKFCDIGYRLFQIMFYIKSDFRTETNNEGLDWDEFLNDVLPFKIGLVIMGAE